MENNWIYWDGGENGECPVEPYTLVSVIFVRDEYSDPNGPIPMDSAKAERFDWHWTNDDGDIIYYKVLKEN